jgi:hypothetical protein
MCVETSKLVLRRPHLGDVPALFGFMADGHIEEGFSL